MTKLEELYSRLSPDDLVALLEEDGLGPVTLRAMAILSEYFGWTPEQMLQRGVTRLLFEEHPDRDLVQHLLEC